MTTFTAADVGKSIDVLIDGQGYVYDDTIDPTSVYSSRQRAQFGLSPIFVQRSNVQGDYGDSQQDFFLTFTQRDWSLGEQQKYVRPNDADSARRYRLGSDIDIHTPGQVSMAFIAANPAAAAAVQAVSATGQGDAIYLFSTTNRYLVDKAGTIGSSAAHGLGAAPSRYGVAHDGSKTYISTTAAGTVGVRSYDGTTFATFSATGADTLCYLNNTLYGYRKTAATGDLIRYDSAGAPTVLFTWKGSDGTILNFDPVPMVAYGGKLLILLDNQLWLSEGAAPSLVAALPSDFIADSLCVSLGIAYIGGVNGYGKSAVMFYANGELGMLWESDGTGTTSVAPQIVPFRNGIFFTDNLRAAFYYYNGATGGVSIISEFSAGGAAPMIAATDTTASNFIVFVPTRGGTDVWTWPAYSGANKQYVATSIIFSSLIDFDSSLTKNFHSVKLDFDLGADGNGGSVDIAYRLNDVTGGGFTTIVTGAVSGTEYVLTGVQGRSIALAITLHRGTSTSGPVVKRYSVRGSPVQPQYFRSLYTLACYGSDRAPEPKRQPLRDVDSHLTKTGAQMVADLRTAAAKTSPITIVDEVNGSYSGIIEPDNFNVDRIRPGEYRVQLVARSV